MHSYVKRSRLACSAQELFDWHCRPEAFIELQPPWERVDQLSKPEHLHAGQLVRISIRLGLLRLPWVSEITEMVPGNSFTDVQRRGPFAYWKHEHHCIADDAGHCWLEDRISYRLPLDPLGGWLAGWLVRRRLEQMFSYRHHHMRKVFGTGQKLSSTH